MNIFKIKGLFKLKHFFKTQTRDEKNVLDICKVQMSFLRPKVFLSYLEKGMKLVAI